MQQHRTRFGHIVFVALLTLSMLLLTVVVDVRPAAAAGFTWSLGSDTATTQFNNVDINPGIFHDGSDLWMLYSDGYNWHRWKGTTMDNLVEQSNGSCGYSACLDSSFNQPYGDDRYWIGGTWVDTSTSPHTWYATVHVEFKYNSLNSGQGNLGYDHFRRIQLATSTDNGATWHDQGDILTSDNSYTMSDYGNYFDFGTGDQTLYVDTTGGYFYVFYWHVWMSKTQGFNDHYDGMRVARCPISSVTNGLHMAAGCWQKWYQGSWNQAGLGGHDSDVLPYADGQVAFFYDTYLSSFVAIGQVEDRNSGFIATATSLDSENWTAPERFTNENPDFSPTTNGLEWYNWVVNPTTWDGMTMGQTFRLYSSQNHYNNNGTKYMNVTFGSGTTTPNNYVMAYPPQSVNDANPGYQSSLNPPAGTHTYNSDLSGGLAGWQTQTSNGTWSVSNSVLNGSINSSTSDTIAVDTNSPTHTNGELSFTVTPISGQRFAALFRYTSTSNWAGIYYDNGNFGWNNGPNQWGNLWSQTLADNTTHTIDIQYTGTSVTVKVDGTQQYSGTISGLPTNAGRIGFRTWYLNASQNFSGITLHYVAPSPYSSIMKSATGTSNGIDLWNVSRQSSQGRWSLSNNVLTGTINSSSDDTIAIDGGSPLVADGDLSFTVTLHSGQRFAALFRYVSTSNWAGIYYDNGNFGWNNGPNQYGNLWSQTLSDNTTHTIDIQYTGTSVTVKVDGTQQYSGTISSLPTGAGQIGMRVWYLNNSQDFSNIQETY